MLVPSITKNLISIFKFTLENNVTLEFDSTCCYIKDKQSKKVLLQGALKNGLYQLHLPQNDIGPHYKLPHNACSTSLFSQQCSSFHTVFPSYEDNNLASAMSCNVDTTILDLPCNTVSNDTLAQWGWSSK